MVAGRFSSFPGIVAGMDQVPDSYEHNGRTYLLWARPDGEWTIDFDGDHVGTLYRYGLGDGAEWEVEGHDLVGKHVHTDGYWPGWADALDEFLDYLR